MCGCKMHKNASNQGLARQRVTTLPDHHQSRGHAKILETLDWWTFTLFLVFLSRSGLEGCHSSDRSQK